MKRPRKITHQVEETLYEPKTDIALCVGVCVALVWHIGMLYAKVASK